MNRKSLFSIVALLVLWMSGLVSYAQVNNDAHRCPMIDYLSRSTRPELTERGWDTVVDCNTRTIILKEQ